LVLFSQLNTQHTHTNWNKLVFWGEFDPRTEIARSRDLSAMAAAIVTEEFNLRELQKALAALEVQPASREDSARAVFVARCMPRYFSPRPRDGTGDRPSTSVTCRIRIRRTVCEVVAKGARRRAT